VRATARARASDAMRSRARCDARSTSVAGRRACASVFYIFSDIRHVQSYDRVPFDVAGRRACASVFYIFSDIQYVQSYDRVPFDVTTFQTPRVVRSFVRYLSTSSDETFALRALFAQMHRNLVTSLAFARARAGAS